MTLTGCVDLYSCENEIVQERLAPNRSRRAVLFQRNCGATTGFSLQVAVAEGSVGPHQLEPAFVTDDNAPGGLASVELFWRDSDHLVIRHHPAAHIFKAEPAAGEVRITYEHQAPII
jgi:hypothetical protein